MRAAEGCMLDLGHAAEIDAYLLPLRARLGSHALSDHAFSNLYLFRAAHAYQYLPGPYPCVAGLTYDGMKHLLPLFDLRQAPLAELERLLAEHDFFYPVDAATAEALDPARFLLSASRDDADYLYPAENFRRYEGALLRKKRSLMRQLLAVHTIEAFSLDAARLDDAKRILHGWMSDKAKSAGEADEESCLDALHLWKRFGMESRIFYADGNPAGFILTQRLAENCAVVRFAKGSDTYRGIYQYMFHQYAVENAAWLQWINFEQDLGLENFRQTKKSYQPSELLAKYRVALRK
jgi:hypothetical protein